MSIEVYHINCGSLLSPPNSVYVPCRGLLLAGDCGLALVDTGIGLLDVQNPAERIGQELIDLAGFQFNEQDTAVRQIEKLGYKPADVRHIFLTHGDPDHSGGLADFPQAAVHISQEELAAIIDGWWRYRASHFDHGPLWRTYGPTSDKWYGLEARPLSFGTDEDFHKMTVLTLP